MLRDGSVGYELLRVDTRTDYMLKRGARDYVLKQRLERLVPAVNRALRETPERYKCERTRAALREWKKNTAR